MIRICFSFSRLRLLLKAPPMPKPHRLYFVKIILKKNDNFDLTLRKRLFCNAKPTLLPCKTAAFAMQNNRFCNALIERELSDSYSSEKYLQHFNPPIFISYRCHLCSKVGKNFCGNRAGTESSHLREVAEIAVLRNIPAEVAYLFHSFYLPFQVCQHCAGYRTKQV